MPRAALRLALAGAAAFVTHSAIAQSVDQPIAVPAAPPPTLPTNYPIKLFRWDEDYSSLALRPRSELPFPLPLKYVPITQEAGIFASFGGEYRVRTDSYSNPDFGARNAADFTSVEQRFLLHADMHLGPDIRAFVQIGAGAENGRKPGPRIGDRSELDFAQAFVDVNFGRTAARWRLRLGRQEVSLGRYVAIRETTNIRRTFDGARLDGKLLGWTMTAVAARSTRNRTGAFDDDPTPGDYLLLVSAERPLPLAGFKIGVGAFERGNRQARYLAGTGDERRRTVGIRIFGSLGGWDADGQVSYQFGRFTPAGGRPLTIFAWGAAFEGGRTFDTRWKPRLALRLDAAGGDTDPNDQRLGTLDLPFPNLAYLTDAAIFAPRNVRDVQPFVVLTPNPKLTLTAGAQFLWRNSSRDAVYSPISTVIVPAGGADSYVATQPYFRANCKISPFVELQLGGVYAIPGAALKGVGGRQSLGFGFASLAFRV